MIPVVLYYVVGLLAALGLGWIARKMTADLALLLLLYLLVVTLAAAAGFGCGWRVGCAVTAIALFLVINRLEE